MRAQATCPPQHAGAKSETIKAEQIGIDISLVGFAVSLDRISLGAATQSLGEPAFDGQPRFKRRDRSGSAAEPEVGRLYCKCAPQK